MSSGSGEARRQRRSDYAEEEEEEDASSAVVVVLFFFFSFSAVLMVSHVAIPRPPVAVVCYPKMLTPNAPMSEGTNLTHGLPSTMAR